MSVPYIDPKKEAFIACSFSEVPVLSLFSISTLLFANFTSFFPAIRFNSWFGVSIGPTISIVLEIILKYGASLLRVPFFSPKSATPFSSIKTSPLLEFVMLKFTFFPSTLTFPVVNVTPLEFIKCPPFT